MKALRCYVPTEEVPVGHWYECAQLMPWASNPSSRMRNDAGFKRLVNDLAKWGQANPVLLAETECGLVVLDGNRRYKAADLLGWQHLWGLCVVKCQYEDVPFYACRLNIVRPWSSREVLELASEAPDVFDFAPADWQTKAVLAYRALREPGEYERLVKTHGFGIRAIDIACRICRYCGWTKGNQVDIERLAQVLRWFMARGSGVIRGVEFALNRKLLGNGIISPDQLRQVIENNRPLQLQW